MSNEVAGSGPNGLATVHVRTRAPHIWLHAERAVTDGQKVTFFNVTRSIVGVPLKGKTIRHSTWSTGVGNLEFDTLRGEICHYS